jgi:hypothetical protein
MWMRRKPLTCTFLCSTGGGGVVVAASGTSGPADGFVAISITILVGCEGARLLHWTLITLKHYLLIHVRLEGPKNVSVQCLLRSMTDVSVPRSLNLRHANCVSESVFLLRVGVSHNVDRDFK